MMMALLLMGAQGSAMIVAVLMLRALLLDHLPKATFCALWALVAAQPARAPLRDEPPGPLGPRLAPAAPRRRWRRSPWGCRYNRYRRRPPQQHGHCRRNAGRQRFTDRSPHTCRGFSPARPHGAGRRSTTGHTR